MEHIKKQSMTLFEMIDDYREDIHKGKYPRVQYSKWKELVKMFSEGVCKECGDSKGEYLIHIQPTTGKVGVRCSACGHLEIYDRGNPLAEYLTVIHNELKAKKAVEAVEHEINIFNVKPTPFEPKPKLDLSAKIVPMNTQGATPEAVAEAWAKSIAHISKDGGYATGGVVIPKPDKPEFILKNKEVKGGNDMFNVNSIFKGFQFGPIKGDAFKLSPLGTAFKTRDGYAVYNVETEEMTDVTGMTFEMNDMVFAMPVAHGKVEVNDIILHSNQAVVVKEVKDKSIVVVFPGLSEIKEIVPVKNMFGFNFYTKIMPLLDLGSATKPDAENPFGNILPFMLMGQNGGQMNPMMMMAMMGGLGEKGGMSSEMMMAMAMSGNGNGNGSNDGMGMALAMMMMNKKDTK